jgi:hypothetical protein
MSSISWTLVKLFVNVAGGNPAYAMGFISIY